LSSGPSPCYSPASFLLLEWYWESGPWSWSWKWRFVNRIITNSSRKKLYQPYCYPSCLNVKNTLSEWLQLIKTYNHCHGHSCTNPTQKHKNYD
jgi:hypothetical protein